MRDLHLHQHLGNRSEKKGEEKKGEEIKGEKKKGEN